MEEGISVASLSSRISTDLDLTSTLRNYIILASISSS